MPKDIKTLTNNNWQTETVTNAELQVSALIRIADSTELIAKNYKKLLDDAERYEKWWREEREKNEKLVRKISALRGVITKLKNRKNIKNDTSL